MNNELLRELCEKFNTSVEYLLPKIITYVQVSNAIYTCKGV